MAFEAVWFLSGYCIKWRNDVEWMYWSTLTKNLKIIDRLIRCVGQSLSVVHQRLRCQKMTIISSACLEKGDEDFAHSFFQMIIGAGSCFYFQAPFTWYISCSVIVILLRGTQKQFSRLKKMFLVLIRCIVKDEVGKHYSGMSPMNSLRQEWHFWESLKG